MHFTPPTTYHLPPAVSHFPYPVSRIPCPVFGQVFVRAAGVVKKSVAVGLGVVNGTAEHGGGEGPPRFIGALRSLSGDVGGEVGQGHQFSIRNPSTCLKCWSRVASAKPYFTLPATRINLFAAVLDRLLHGFQIPWIYGSGETQQIPTGHGSRCRQTPGELQQLALLRVVKPINLFNNLISDSLAHGGTS